MAVGLTLGASSLVEGWFTSSLCGLNIVLYFLCLRILCTRSSQQSSRTRWLLALSSTAQISICFAQSAVFLASNYHAFVTLDGGQAATIYFAKNNSPLDVAEECFYTINDWIGSGILLWRACVINNHSWKITAPLILLWFGLLATLTGALYQLTHLPSTVQGNFEPSLTAWVLAFTVLSLALQVIATALIAWRIWISIRVRKRHAWARDWYWHALRVVVESGVLYGVLTLLSLAFYLARVEFGDINVGILTQVSATCPFLIILRAHAYREQEVRKLRVETKDVRRTWASRRSSSQGTGDETPMSPQGVTFPPESARTQYTVELQLPSGLDKA